MKLDKEKPIRTTILALLSVIIIPVLWIIIPYFFSTSQQTNPAQNQINATKKPSITPGSLRSSN